MDGKGNRSDSKSSKFNVRNASINFKLKFALGPEILLLLGVTSFLQGSHAVQDPTIYEFLMQTWLASSGPNLDDNNLRLGRMISNPPSFHKEATNCPIYT
jgi:hypothetical protein